MIPTERSLSDFRKCKQKEAASHHLAAALSELNDALLEVIDLQSVNPIVREGLPRRLEVVRAVNRSAVMLLSIHFERYLRRVNEESLELLNEHEIDSAKIPRILRLEHSAVPVDEMTAMQWPHRSDKLIEFVAGDAWLWGVGPRAPLDPTRMLRWFRSPNPKRIRRFYRLWGIDNIFDEITRKSDNRLHLELKIQELVDKRNNIAHGDFLQRQPTKM